MSANNLILVVDDEPNIRLLISTALQTEGWQICEAAGSAEAIATLQRESPAVILLDLHLPPGPDGMAVLEFLRPWPASQRPRVIVLTAHGGVTEAVKAVRLGASDFLLKPVTPKDLRLSVAAAMRETVPHDAVETRAVANVHKRDAICGQVLPRIRSAVWNKDINRIELLLGKLFRKAAAEPAYNNLLGVVFEAEGNRAAARTFYQKAAALSDCEAARQNLERLAELEHHGFTASEIDMADQNEFLDQLCEQEAAHR